MLAYLLVEEISSLLPVSFGFAGGAMLALVFVELIPQSVSQSSARPWSAPGSVRR